MMCSSIWLRAWRRTEFYQTFNRRFGHDYELDVILPGVAANGVAVISVARGTRDFTRHEVEVLRALQQPLTIALRRLLLDECRQRWLLRQPLAVRDIRAAFPALTPREAEVLVWLCESKSDAEIAAILDQSRLTTSTHVRNIMAKLGVESRLAATLSTIRRVLMAN